MISGAGAGEALLRQNHHLDNTLLLEEESCQPVGLSVNQRLALPLGHKQEEFQQHEDSPHAAGSGSLRCVRKNSKS